MVDIHVNQVVFLINVKNIPDSMKFDYKSYREYYHKDIPKNKRKDRVMKQTVDNYAVRKTIDFSYKISKNLKIFLFITNNFTYWLSAEGFCFLLRNLVDDLERYIVNIPVIDFDYKIVNILTTFSIKHQQFEFLRSIELNILQNFLNEFNNLYEIYPQALYLTPQGETRNYTINTKNSGSLKIYSYQQRGSIISKSVESVEKLEKFFWNFCQYYHEKYVRVSDRDSVTY